jgi:hypothetical protein
MTICGYAGVSTDGQTLDARIAALKAARAERVFSENKAVGRTPTLRPRYESQLKNPDGCSLSSAPIVAAAVPVRIDSEYAVDPANDTAGRPTNDTTNNAADRPEHAVTGIGPAVGPVVYSSWYALRLRNDRHGNKEAQRNDLQHSHQGHLFLRPFWPATANCRHEQIDPLVAWACPPPRAGPVALQSQPVEARLFRLRTWRYRHANVMTEGE